VAEFRALVERQVKALGSKQLDAVKRVRHVEVTLANLEDSLAELEEALRVETGALMQVHRWSGVQVIRKALVRRDTCTLVEGGGRGGESFVQGRSLRFGVCDGSVGTILDCLENILFSKFG
jgi:hypothetical protein